MSTFFRNLVTCVDEAVRPRHLSHCRYCGHPVLWRVTTRGKNLPLHGHEPHPVQRWETANGVKYAAYSTEDVHFAKCPHRPARPRRYGAAR